MTIYDQCSKISKTINEIYKREFLKNLHIRSLTEQNKEYKKLLKLEADKQEFFKLATAGAEPREYDKYFEDDDDEIEREARTTADQQEFLRLAAAAEREELEREARLRAYADKGKEIVQRAVQTELNERRAREARAATEADDERAAIEAEAARAAAERAAIEAEAARAAAERAAAERAAAERAAAERAAAERAAIEAEAARAAAERAAAELKADKQAALQVAENVTKRQIAAKQKHEERIQNAAKPTSSGGGTRRFKLKMNQTKRLKRGKKRRYNVTRTFKRRFTNRIDKLFILR
jgi:tRNA threonylcarbamoyladenosine modification (KEOPS) complex  Pcc1 subunit